jgi:biopolymer transport protein ExbD
MRFRKSTITAELDWTPMIDITFQLITFFLFVLSFSDSEQDERIQLPESELAKPSENVLEFPVTLHLTKEGTVIIGGQETTIADVQTHLVREANLLELRGKPLSTATIVIRAHKDVPAGKVQELIKQCQMHRFENFILRAQEKLGA